MHGRDRTAVSGLTQRTPRRLPPRRPLPSAPSAPMASIGVLSPRPMAAAASLDVTALNTLCSGSLDELIAAQPQQPSPLRRAAAGAAPAATAPAAAAPGPGAADPAREQKVRAATEYVKKSWQYKVGPMRAPGVGRGTHQA